MSRHRCCSCAGAAAARRYALRVWPCSSLGAVLVRRSCRSRRSSDITQHPGLIADDPNARGAGSHRSGASTRTGSASTIWSEGADRRRRARQLVVHALLHDPLRSVGGGAQLVSRRPWRRAAWSRSGSTSLLFWSRMRGLRALRARAGGRWRAAEADGIAVAGCATRICLIVVPGLLAVRRPVGSDLLLLPDRPRRRADSALQAAAGPCGAGDRHERCAMQPRLADPSSPTAAGGADGARCEPSPHFLAGTGHRVVRSAGALLVRRQPGLLPEPAVAPSAACRAATSCAPCLRHQPCLGVRFPAPLDGPGKLSYQIVCDDARLRHRAAERQRAQQGAARAAPLRGRAGVRSPTIAAAGLAADRDTLSRQGRAVRLDGPAWHALLGRGGGDAGHGGLGGVRRAARWRPSWSPCSSTTASSSCWRARAATCLDAYPNNALIFQVARRNARDAAACARSPSGWSRSSRSGPLDQFKFGMGFRAAPAAPAGRLPSRCCARCCSRARCARWSCR